MFRNLQLDATRVYLFMEIATGMFIGMVFMTNSLYEATIAGLTPLQLVLVGTTLEISVFLFEVPTGIVADVYSRRLSIVIGYLLMGAGFLIEGFFPTFRMIVLAQVVWGVGYTFTSGAKQAWITDEIGEDNANKLFLRTARLGTYAWMFALGVTLLIGTNNVAIPIRVGALGVILIGILLTIIMPERGFHPTPQEDRNTWQHMWHIFKQGVSAVRMHPRLGNIVFIGLFYGLYSEGFDRLSVKLLVDNFSLPVFFGSNQVSFFFHAGCPWGDTLHSNDAFGGETPGYQQSARDWPGHVAGDRLDHAQHAQFCACAGSFSGRDVHDRSGPAAWNQ